MGPLAPAGGSEQPCTAFTLTKQELSNTDACAPIKNQCDIQCKSSQDNFDYKWNVHNGEGALGG